MARARAEALERGRQRREHMVAADLLEETCALEVQGEILFHAGQREDDAA